MANQDFRKAANERAIEIAESAAYQRGSGHALIAVYCALADLGADPLAAAQWLSYRLVHSRGRRVPPFGLPADVEKIMREAIADHLREECGIANPQEARL